MAGKKVKLKDQLGRVIDLNADATAGATVGKDIFGPDGKLLKPSEIINPAPAPSNATATVWKLIREVPANLLKLAALSGKGFSSRDEGGEWALRTLQQGTGIDVANGDGEDGNPSVALNEASIASLELADSSVQEVRQGAGVTVDNSDPRRPIVSATGGGAGGGILPVVTGEITAGQPVFLIADDGNLIYTEIT